MKKKVAIQGIAGSYHDIAARNYHEGEEIEIIPCNTFRDVITTIKKDPSDTRHDGHREYDSGKSLCKIMS